MTQFILKGKGSVVQKYLWASIAKWFYIVIFHSGFSEFIVKTVELQTLLWIIWCGDHMMHD